MASSWSRTPADNSTWVCGTGCLGLRCLSPTITTTTAATPHPPFKAPRRPPAPAGALAGTSSPVAVPFQTEATSLFRHSRRLIKGMICGTPSFYSINQQHKAVKTPSSKNILVGFFAACLIDDGALKKRRDDLF